MHMKRTIRLTTLLLAAFLVLSCGAGKHATESMDPELKAALKERLPEIEAKAADVLKAAYMTENEVRTDLNVKDWEGFPVKLCTYHTGLDSEFGVKKLGKVYLLNPTPEKLATWVATAVWTVKGSLDTESIDKMLQYIKWQSGGQFPVCGVVYEDMEGDGTYYPYIFKDGVTVYLPDGPLKSMNPNEEQLDAYLTLRKEDLKGYTGRYARICSTTREQYKAAGGKLEVGTGDSEQTRKPEWMDAIREEYQKAWNSSYNFLFIAWAKDNL